jgi:transcriptional regulator with XRE-family HTH domain
VAARRRPDDDQDSELGRALSAARAAVGMMQTEVAEAVSGLTQARLSRIERGIAVPTVEDMTALLDLYSVHGDARSELEAVAAETRGGIRDQRLVVQRGRTSAMQARWARIERDARVIRSYQPALVLGVLQVAGYAAVVLDLDAEAIRSRAERQTAFAAKPAQQHLLIQTEGALRMTVGSAQLMAEQLDRLVEVSSLPNVQLGVIPANRPMPFTCGTAFHLYEGDGGSAAVVGLEVASARLTDAADVAHFAALFDRLAATAVYGDDARTILSVIAMDYRAADYRNG